MTQLQEQAKKIAELNSLFVTLSEKGQENALNILRSLDFAQSVMLKSNQSPKSPAQPPTH